MPEMTVKEWAAQYKLINEAEREDLKRRLPLEPVEESVRSYFALSRLALAFSGGADEPQELQAARARDFQNMIERWTHLAQGERRADRARSAATRR